MNDSKKSPRKEVAKNKTDVVEVLINLSQTVAVLAEKIDEMKENMQSQQQIRLGDKEILTSVKEMVQFLNEECGFRITEQTAYQYLHFNSNDTRFKRNSFLTISRAIPGFKRGKYWTFDTKELREWAGEQIKRSRIQIPS